MGGGSSQTTTQSQNSSTTANPYAPTQGLLGNIIAGLNGISTSPTSSQSTAAANLVNSANSIPDLSKELTGVTTGALSGDPTGLLNRGYTNLSSNIGDIASGSANPLLTPGLSDALAAARKDASDSTNGMFAAAGRDLSPANSFSTARGIEAAEAPILVNQYNQNLQNKMAAAGTLYNAGNTTAGNITNTQQTGMSDAGSLPGLLTMPAQTQLNAATSQAQLPLSTIQQLEALGLPIASTFGTTNSEGSGSGTTTQNQSLASTIMGGLLGAAGLAGKFMSDPALKENAEPVGILNDGQTVWRYNYVGDSRPQIGLMADEVERTAPDAVSRIGGFRAVDYGRATDRAAKIGGLLDLKRAA